MPDFLRKINSQPLIFLATLSLLVTVLSVAQRVLIPFTLAILLAFLLNPLVRLVQSRGFRRIPAVVFVSIVAFVLLGILSVSILSQFVILADNTPKYGKILIKKIRSFRGEGESTVGKVFQTTKKVTKELGEGSNNDETPEEEPAKEKKVVTPVVPQADVGGMISFFAATAQEVIRLVASIGLVIALVLVILVYREELRDRFIRLTGSTRLTITTKALDEASQRISDYMLRKLVINSIHAGVITIVLFFLGVPFSLLWGFLLAVLRFIPGLGVWLAAVPPVLLCLVAFESWWQLVFVATLYGIGELILINLVEPRFLGRQIGLLPVATMISLTFWTWLWGPIGLLLAIPLTMCLAVLGKYVPPLSFLHTLLSDQPAMDATLRYYQRLLANDADEAMEVVDSYLAEKGKDNLYDELFLPALSHTRKHVVQGDLKKEDQDFFFRITNEILDELSLEEPGNGGSQEETDRCFPIVGIPINDEGDRLCLRMTNQQLHRHSCNMSIANAGLLSAEAFQWAKSFSPTVVCIASIAPGNLAQTRMICKRLRSELPDLKIAVLRVENSNSKEKDSEELQHAGANVVCRTITEAKDHILRLSQKAKYENVAL